MKVFVYGTLRNNEINSHYLVGARAIATQCWTEGELWDTGLGYPAMVNVRKGKVYGEIYQIREEQLKVLDELEEFIGEGNKENYYERILKTIYTDRGQVKAYVYILPEEKLELAFETIDSGDWKWHRLQSRQDFLYFSYGSCMDNERFKEHGVAYLFEDILGRGKLKGFSLRYTRQTVDGGKADIVEVGGLVEGKVYRIGYDALKYLLVREGVNKRAYRPALVELEIDGQKKLDVLTFIVVEKRKETLPSRKYFREILRGAQGTVSKEYLKKLMDHYQILKNNSTIKTI